MRFRLLRSCCVGRRQRSAAQSTRVSRFLDNCQRDRSDYGRACDSRDFTIAAVKELSVDGRENGGIAVHGWDGLRDIQVVAMIQAQAETDSEASAIAKQVTSQSRWTAGIRSERRGPPETIAPPESWSVSYEIWAPRQTDLTLNASNGGIAVDGVDARLELETVNGGLNLIDVEGNVRGRPRPTAA